MARVAALVPDLLFGSKVKAMLEAEGHTVQLVGRPEQVEAADVLVIDLASGDIDARQAVEAAAGARTLAFYSHVELEARRTAEAAGIDQIVPRSRMAREGGQLVSRLAAG
jgi:hypothetical protein